MTDPRVPGGAPSPAAAPVTVPAAPLVARSTMHELPRTHPLEGRGSLGLWLALSASPAGWFLGQVVAYAMTQHQCVARATWPLHVATVLCLAIVIAGGVLSLGYWTRIGRDWPDDAPGPEMRYRFLAALGAVGSLFFGAILLFQWVSEFILHPCLTT